MPDYAAQRANMVMSQIHANGVTEAAILDAFGNVPREHFVPAEKRSVAYADAPVQIVHGRWLLEPRTFAKLIELGEVDHADTVLDVGCVTGYSTAVLAQLARRVVGLEQDVDLVRIASEKLREAEVHNAAIVQGSLAEGARGNGPYNVIVIEGGIEQTPQRLLAQLADGGRLVAILQRQAQGHAIVYLNEGGRIGHRLTFDACAPVLNGFREPAGFVF